MGLRGCREGHLRGRVEGGLSAVRLEGLLGPPAALLVPPAVLHRVPAGCWAGRYPRALVHALVWWAAKASESEDDLRELPTIPVLTIQYLNKRLAC